jgi:putative transposase
LGQEEQAELRAAIQAPPEKSAIGLASWTWKGVRAFVQRRWGLLFSRSTCLNYLHRLGFVLKRPKKRLLKADAAKREAFVVFYRQLLQDAQASGAKIFFVDEAHFWADVCLRAMWVLRGTPALVESTSPRLGEKVSYYSGVCLETGEVEAMPVMGNCNAETSAAFLRQLREKHPEPLIVIWDNGPAHRGQAIRTYLTTPGLRLTLVALPAYSPDFNSDEAIWNWVRQEVTANHCFGTQGKLHEALAKFFAGLAQRTTEVVRRCRTVLQPLDWIGGESLEPAAAQLVAQDQHVDFTLA